MVDEQAPSGVRLPLSGEKESPDGFMPCSWIAPEVCSNPRCVELAYAEARLREPSVLILPDEIEIERGGFLGL